jgi:hypothetical protein
MAVNEQEWNQDKELFVSDRSPHGPLARQFTILTRALLDAGTVAEALQRIVVAAQELIPNADVVSVTLRSTTGEFYTPVETNQVAVELDQLQYHFGEGPCVEAALVAGPAVGRSDDLAVEPLWPRFGPATAERGFNSVLSTALLPDARPPRLSGALNLYSRSRGGLTSADGDIALLLSTHGSLALAHTRAVTAAGLQATNLQKAIDSRDVIGQAKGILMSRRRIGADEAFDILRRTSQELNVKLADLAKTLTTRYSELDRS